MKHQTAALTGADLNRAVAMALGRKIVKLEHKGHWWYMIHTLPGGPIFGNTEHIPNYAGDISVAWPIIKERRIGIEHSPGRPAYAYMPDYSLTGQFDDDPQVAALRAFVASVYGAEVELP